jgi:peptide subunit release factor 1 (eRF1)
VRTLLVDAVARSAGFRCIRTGRLTTSANGCEGNDDRAAVPDVIDEAIEDALRQGGHVNVVEHRDVQPEVDGLAALLRFQIGR